jgi:hypothetical protein
LPTAAGALPIVPPETFNDSIDEKPVTWIGAEAARETASAARSFTPRSYGNAVGWGLSR